MPIAYDAINAKSVPQEVFLQWYTSALSLNQENDRMHMADKRFRSGPSRKSGKAIFIIAGVVLLGLVAHGIFGAGSIPGIKIEPAMPVIGKRTPVTVEISEPRRGLTRVTVELIQGEKAVKLKDLRYPAASQFAFWSAKVPKDTFVVEAGRQTMPALTGGMATVRVTAERAGTWLRTPAPKVEEIALRVQLTPPSLQVESTQTYVSQGGCEAVVYRVGESAVRDGVRVGSWWFPGFSLPGGGKQDRFAFFAVPFDMAEPDVYLVVEDAAGNSTERSFIDKFFPKPYRSDDLDISDAFLSKVVPEILSQTSDLNDKGNLLDNYLAINRDLRSKDAEIIRQLAQKSQPAFLWKKPFSTIPNGKLMAGFAEQRTYHYKGQVIDHQTHLGFDLAVTKRCPVPAANDGIVVYARYFGIYGNAVLIDHGYGLMSIYGHLSSIGVKEGQQVSKGDIIGKTGETGLAGGDHLHFCTILQGLPVDPSEWCDGHWIQDRISRKLGSAFSFSPN
jgi:murein DD-endopeptidase MepM/ murein hydrolase activator NlpD